MQQAPARLKQLIDLFSSATFEVVTGKLTNIKLPQRKGLKNIRRNLFRDLSSLRPFTHAQSLPLSHGIPLSRERKTTSFPLNPVTGRNLAELDR